MFTPQKIEAASKPQFYAELAQQLDGLIGDETDRIANLANMSALLFDALPDLNWAGFYLLRDGELVLGPFQGKTACVRIAVGRAVIGVIVAELFTSVTGLGARMTYYSNFFQTANYFAALLMFILFSVAVTEAVRLIEVRFVRWRAD